MRYSAIITCQTECSVCVEASSPEDAKAQMERGEFAHVHLYDGGLAVTERFHDIEVDEESFGQD